MTGGSTGPRRASVRWVVGASGPRALSEILARLGPIGDGALAQGRAFVDGRRAAADATLAIGAVVQVSPARTAPDEVPVLARVGGFVVVDKPAELATEPDRSGGGSSLLHRVARALQVAPTTLHAVSRLDVGVSGAVTFATDAASRRQAVRLREAGKLRRRYLAIAERAPVTASGEWNTPVQGRTASTRFAIVARSAGAWRTPRGEDVAPALLALEPETGRMHQLRVHAAHAGSPLLGDRPRGGATRLVGLDGSILEVPRVCLHCGAVVIGLDGSPPEVRAPVPRDLVDFWRELGGAPEDFEAAGTASPLSAVAVRSARL